MDIERVTKGILAFLGEGERPLNVIAGAGRDDTAVVRVGASYIVLTSDFINYRPAMLSLGVGSYYDYGYVLVGNSLSDLCGSGAEPCAVMLNVMFPRDFDYTAALDIVRGARDISASVGVDIVGGDTKGGERLVASATAIGSVSDPSELILRTSARPGHLIALSGPIGDFAAAVYALSRRDLMLSDRLRREAARAITRPDLPFATSSRLRFHRASLGGLDISDGLGGDLHLLASGSSVGVSIVADQIPVGHLAREIGEIAGIPPFAFALASGGDWQFVFTYPRELAGPGIDDGVVIGEVTDARDCALRIGARVVELPRWRHIDFLHTDFAAEIHAVISQLTQLA